MIYSKYVVGLAYCGDIAIVAKVDTMTNGVVPEVNNWDNQNELAKSSRFYILRGILTYLPLSLAVKPMGLKQT